jgi:hypothetical protein
MSKVTADLICRALLAIVAALRKEYGLPAYHDITIHVEDTLAGAVEYGTMTPTTK